MVWLVKASTSSSSLVNSVDVLETAPFDVCFCSFLGLTSPSASSSSVLPLPFLTTASLLRLIVLVLPLLVDEVRALLDVIAAVRGGGAVCEKRHGLRLHGPPGLLADSSGHLTEANKPSVGNIELSACSGGRQSPVWCVVQVAEKQRSGARCGPGLE